jgi:hypothetical protein
MENTGGKVVHIFIIPIGSRAVFHMQHCRSGHYKAHLQHEVAKSAKTVFISVKR